MNHLRSDQCGGKPVQSIPHLLALHFPGSWYNLTLKRVYENWDRTSIHIYIRGSREPRGITSV